MYSISLLKALFTHMQWADAEVWSALLDTSGAAKDKYIAKTLFHIRFTHYAYSCLLRGESVPFPDRKQFNSLSEPTNWARTHYADTSELLTGLSEEDLEEVVPVPWSNVFEKGTGSAAAETTRGDILYQITAHSQYHRAQINRRIRELGKKPPLVDYIVWKWKHNPSASWR